MSPKGFKAFLFFIVATWSFVNGRVGGKEPEVFDDEGAIVQELVERMKPRNLEFDGKEGKKQYISCHSRPR